MEKVFSEIGVRLVGVVNILIATIGSLLASIVGLFQLVLTGRTSIAAKILNFVDSLTFKSK